MYIFHFVKTIYQFVEFSDFLSFCVKMGGGRIILFQLLSVF